jgi:hypothetical protein
MLASSRRAAVWLSLCLVVVFGFACKPKDSALQPASAGGSSSQPNSIRFAPVPDAEPDSGGDAKWDVEAPSGEPTTVDIDVREGTWMSLDVSPDGTTLVFDLLGDLYTLPIEGGDAPARPCSRSTLR